MNIEEEQRLHIWLLSPYHTGSHRSWALGYTQRSRHRTTLLTMTGRFWKWRMQGGAIELAHAAQKQLRVDEDVKPPYPDTILTTDMVNLPVWLGFMRHHLPAQIPILHYMHENQLTYPSRPNERPDLTYAMINWLSQLSADRTAFNSHYHRRCWFAELPRLLKHFPDYNHLSLIEQVYEKSVVLPVGIACREIVEIGDGATRNVVVCSKPTQAPLIVWNQRWEYDKRPDRFFRLLYRLQGAGVDFRLAVAGENFRNVPQEFEEARQRLADKIVHWGFVDSYEAYIHLLHQADLVISTADHEFFGISILEAIAAGAFPLLPHRLSYPELIPTELHPACLYTDEDDLFQKACQRLAFPRAAPPSLHQHVIEQFDWSVVTSQYDDFFETLSLSSASRTCF